MFGLRWLKESTFPVILTVDMPHLVRKDAYIREDLHYYASVSDSNGRFYGYVTNDTRGACRDDVLDFVEELQQRRNGSGLPPFQLELRYPKDDDKNSRYGWEDPDIGGGRPYRNLEEKAIYEKKHRSLS